MAPSRDPAAGTAFTSSWTTLKPTSPASGTLVLSSATTFSKDPAADRSCFKTPPATSLNSSNQPIAAPHDEIPCVDRKEHGVTAACSTPCQRARGDSNAQPSDP